MRRITGLVALTLLAGAVPSARAGSFRWSTRGPVGGPLSAVVVDPSNVSVVYVGSANGGVFKTMDGGAHWSPSRVGLSSTGSLSVNCLVVDPVHPTTLYAGLEGGLFKSVDGAAHWVSSSEGMPAAIDIRAIAVDPTNTARLLSGDSTTGVWESVDGGAHWSPRTTGMESDRFVISLAIDPASPLKAFAGTFNGHLYRTVNGGGSWAPSQNGLPAVSSCFSILIDPANSSRMWAGCDDVYRSADRGATWTPGNVPSGDFVSIALAAPGSQTLLAVAFGGGPFRSTDGGAHWFPVATGLSGHAFVSVAADPAHAGHFYLAGDHALKTTDSGSHWTVSEQGLASQEIQCLARDPGTPTRLYAGSSGYGVFRSTDDAASWQAPVTGDEFFVSGIAVDPANSQALVAAAFGDKAIRSADGGVHWAMSDAGLAGNWFYAIVAAGSPATLYIAGDEDTSAPVHGGGVFVSHDHGATWQPRNAGLSEHNVYALAVDPGNPSVLYAGTLTGVFKTSNAAQSWAPASTGLPAQPNVSVLTADPLDPGTIFANVRGKGIFKSVDGAAHWNPVGTGIPDFAPKAIAVAGQTPGLVYVATYGGGISRSLDGGAHWSPLNAGLDDLFAVAILAEDDRERVFAGIDGGSVQEFDFFHPPIIPVFPPAPRTVRGAGR